MNFVTFLPKKEPLVEYKVISAEKCSRKYKILQEEDFIYRMHAVVLF